VYNYKCRAETVSDVIYAIQGTIRKIPKVYIGKVRIIQCDDGPDCDFSFSSFSPLEQLVETWRQLDYENGEGEEIHVMVETLNYAELYTGVRDRTR